MTILCILPLILCTLANVMPAHGMRRRIAFAGPADEGRSDRRKSMSEPSFVFSHQFDIDTLSPRSLAVIQRAFSIDVLHPSGISGLSSANRLRDHWLKSREWKRTSQETDFFDTLFSFSYVLNSVKADLTLQILAESAEPVSDLSSQNRVQLSTTNLLALAGMIEDLYAETHFASPPKKDSLFGISVRKTILGPSDEKAASAVKPDYAMTVYIANDASSLKTAIHALAAKYRIQLGEKSASMRGSSFVPIKESAEFSVPCEDALPQIKQPPTVRSNTSGFSPRPSTPVCRPPIAALIQRDTFRSGASIHPNDVPVGIAQTLTNDLRRRSFRQRLDLARQASFTISPQEQSPDSTDSTDHIQAHMLSPLEITSVSTVSSVSSEG